MRLQIGASLVAILLGGAACSKANDTDVAANTAETFALTGSVVSATSGPRPTAMPTFSPSARGGMKPKDGGSMRVRPADRSVLSGVAECGKTGSVVTIYYSKTTTFAPDTLAQASNFPRNLRGKSVDIDGVAGDKCTLVASAVTESSSPAASGTGGAGSRVGSTSTASPGGAAPGSSPGSNPSPKGTLHPAPEGAIYDSPVPTITPPP